jgi:excisionase family DNA binding protein
MIKHDELLIPDEAARILGVSRSTLELWRNTGSRQLPFLNVKGGDVRYRKADVLALKAARRQREPLLSAGPAEGDLRTQATPPVEAQ